MTEYGTIKIPIDEWQKHNDHRQDLGLTWAEYLNAEAYQGGKSVPADIDYGRVREVVREEVRTALQEAPR